MVKKIKVRGFELRKEKFLPEDMEGQPVIDSWSGEFDDFSPFTIQINTSNSTYRVSPCNGSDMKFSEWKEIDTKVDNILAIHETDFEWEY